MEYVCIIVCVWKRFSLSSSMVSFREELHLKCATLSKVKICSCSCVQLCVHANKGRKKMKTNHLVAQLKFSLSPSLTHSHILSLISGFQILNLALIWPYFLSAPEPQVLPALSSLCSSRALCHFILQTCWAFSSWGFPLHDQYLSIPYISAQRHFEEVFPKVAFPDT